MAQKHTATDEWFAAAERLKMVRQACLTFVDLWAQSRVARMPRAIDRVVSDVDAQAESALADPSNHDWSILYLGSVLDD